MMLRHLECILPVALAASRRASCMLSVWWNVACSVVSSSNCRRDDCCCCSRRSRSCVTWTTWHSLCRLVSGRTSKDLTDLRGIGSNYCWGVWEFGPHIITADDPSACVQFLRGTNADIVIDEHVEYSKCRINQLWTQLAHSVLGY